MDNVKLANSLAQGTGVDEGVVMPVVVEVNGETYPIRDVIYDDVIILQLGDREDKVSALEIAEEASEMLREMSR